MRQTLNKSFGDWIGDMKKDDRNLGGGGLGSTNRLALESYDQINAITYE